MSERNYSLAMIALVLRVYHMESRSTAMMRTSAEPAFADLRLRADQVAALLQASGLSCMSIKVHEGDMPKSLQDFADDRHLVLVGMRASAITPYPHWSVLEASRNDGIALCIFGDSPDPIHTSRHIADVVTGEYVVIVDQVEKDDLEQVRRDFRG